MLKYKSKESKEGAKSTYVTKSKLLDFNPTVSVITLNVNELNTPKTLSHWIKTEPKYMAV